MDKNRCAFNRGKGSAKHNPHKHLKGDKDVNIRNYEGALPVEIDDEFGSGIVMPECSDEDLYVSELKFYERFIPMNEEQNERHRAERHFKRVKNIKEFYNTKLYAPDEEIIQYGNVMTPDDELPTKEEWIAMLDEFDEWLMNWSKEHGGNLVIFSRSDHFDETTTHSHRRTLWMYKDENGMWRCGDKDKAMELAGIERPNQEQYEKDLEAVEEWHKENIGNYEKGTDDYKAFQKEYKLKKAAVSRYNNRQMEFTKMCRTKWQDICDEHGFPVEREPLPMDEKIKHKSNREYVRSKIAETQALQEQAQKILDERDKIIADAKAEAERQANEIINGAYKKLGQKVVKNVTQKGEQIGDVKNGSADRRFNS